MSAILGVQHRILARRTGTAENGLSPVSHVSGQEFSTPLSTGGTARYLGNSAPTNPADLGYVSGRRVVTQVGTVKPPSKGVEYVISVPQETRYESIYDSWGDYPQSPTISDLVLEDDPSPWYQFFDDGNGFRIIWNAPPLVPTPGTETASFSQRINVLPFTPGNVRFTMTGVDDEATVTIGNANDRDDNPIPGNPYTLSASFSYPGTGESSGWLYLGSAVGSIVVTATVTDTIAGGAGVGFRLEFARDVPVVLED